MNCGVNRQVILDKHFKVISFVNINEGAGLLAIDKIDHTADTVYTKCKFSGLACCSLSIRYLGLSFHCVL
jgi:hypothetical protein